MVKLPSSVLLHYQQRPGLLACVGKNAAHPIPIWLWLDSTALSGFMNGLVNEHGRGVACLTWIILLGVQTQIKPSGRPDIPEQVSGYIKVARNRKGSHSNRTLAGFSMYANPSCRLMLSDWGRCWQFWRKLAGWDYIWCNDGDVCSDTPTFYCHTHFNQSLFYCHMRKRPLVYGNLASWLDLYQWWDCDFLLTCNTPRLQSRIDLPLHWRQVFVPLHAGD